MSISAANCAARVSAPLAPPDTMLSGIPLYIEIYAERLSFNRV
jgi:hypothetical protein